MLDRGEEVRLGFVATRVGKNEVVGEIERVARPWDKVVDLRLGIDVALAVKARTRLDVAKDLGMRLERSAFGAEQELVKVFPFTQHAAVRLEAADKAQPLPPHQFLHQAVEAPQRKHYSGMELDAVHGLAPPVRIEEFVVLASEGLELLERHGAHCLGNLANERRPSTSVALCRHERAVKARVHVPHRFKDDGVRLRDLSKNGAVRRGPVRNDRPGRDF